MSFLFGFLMLATALFLILLVLIQRGRGGGLAGAFGGSGGQSAFGTKAGDLFTRITIGVAAFWIILCVGAIKVLGRKTDLFGPDSKPAAESKEPGIGATPSNNGTAAKPTGTDTKPSTEKDTTPAGDKGSTPAGGAEPTTPGAKDSAPAGGKDAASDALTPPSGPPPESKSTAPPK